MKKYLLTTFLSFLAVIALPAASHLEASLQWSTDYTTALAKSKEEQKPVVLFFTGSDWCTWCSQLKKEVLDTSAFANLAGDRYIFVELDFPKRSTQSPQISEQNDSLAKKYSISSYPTLVVVDSDGNTLGETGYKSGGPENFASILDGIVAPHQSKFKSK